MTAADLQRFLDEHTLTRREFGRLIDVSQDRLRRMLAGEVPIREHIALACEALVRRRPPHVAIHHIDGDRTNNDLSNLQLVDIRDHV